MKKLLLIFGIIISLSTIGQTNFSFTKIPTTSTDLIKPGAGLEFWIYQYTVPYPVAGGGTDEANNAGDRYDRFEWRSFENGTQGVYNWTEFDNSINAAIAKKQKFSFGIMTLCTSCTDYATSVGGATLNSYPLYLHTLMQAEATNSKDWIANGSWIPNYNSTNYLNRHKALLDALAAHISSTSFNGVPYSRVIRYIDVRGIGDYNEWHHYGYLDQIPTGRFPVVATYKRVVDDYIAAFPNYQLVALSDGFDTQGSSNTPAEVVSYLLSAKNNVGKLGYRRDNIGSGFQWVDSKLDNNPAVYGGVNLKDSITTRWKTAPAVGEPMNCCSIDGGSVIYFDLSRQISFYHINSMGNGNYEDGTSANTVQKVRDAAKLMGFRYLPASGSMATAITGGVPFNITLNWINEGNSPTYERWYIDYTLRNTTTNAVVWTGTSAYNLRGLIPLASNTPVSESFTVPTSVPSGTYKLHMTVRDSAGYRNPMPLFITGVQTDGSYILRSTVTVSSTGNTPPVANAGSDKAIVLPISSTTLDGSGSDADGTISSYAWTKISGPAGGSIASPSSAVTGITVVAAGTYVFRITVTDNSGAIATDDVSVVASPAANQAPVANAGANQTITLPVNSVTFIGSGTDADGTITGYSWTKVSGPASGTITAPSASSTTVTGLTAGTYVYRLTVTDNNGAINADDVQVIVNSAPPVNQPPVANAGVNITITSPTSSVTLNGSATDADGTISSYLWIKVSGTGGVITSPGSASTTVTGLSVGTYTFRLTATDNSSATGSDDIVVTVNAAPNQAPTANAGVDQTITLPVSTVTLSGSGTDPDGTISSYAWTKVSGPASGSITSASSASTTITALIEGTYVYRLTVTDNNGATGTDNIQIIVNPAIAPTTSNWIFTNTTVAPSFGNDGSGITLGVKFRATTAGGVLRIRFWKTIYSTGTHTGGIYSSSGTLLASGTFTGETSSGWQYLTLNDTVFISANTTYIAAVFMPNGQYGYQGNRFASTVTNNVMQAPASTLVGGNGIYSMGGSLTFPTSSFNKTNYWVDAEWINVTPSAPVNVGPTVSAGLDAA